MESRGLHGGKETAASTIGPLYLIIFANLEVNFRFAEVQSAADYLDIRYAFVSLTKAKANLSKQESNESVLETDRVFALCHLANDDDARRLASRVTSIRAIWQHWTSAATLEDVQRSLCHDQNVRKIWLPWRTEKTSWRATVFGYMRSISEHEKRQRIESFADVLDFNGPINLREPDCEWCYAEEWTPPRQLDVEDELSLDGLSFTKAKDEEQKERPQRQRLLAVHVGRKVTEGTGRELIARMNVKQRAYIGNTTMESGMSLVQANMALAGPGKLIYDPFAGTGSLLLACAALGAYVVGSDIDGRMLRGKPDDAGQIGIVRSAVQYGIETRFVDALNFDVCQHPLRRGAIFDAIVADPPYGVRAGAKRLGRRVEEKLRTEPYVMPDGTYSHQRIDYVPPSKPYALDDLLSDLMHFAAYMLVPKGRLVFWMPTMIDVEEEGLLMKKANGESARQIEELRLPSTRDFRLVAHSLQDFNNWGRRLITLEKIERGEEEHSLTLPSAPCSHVQSAAEAIKASEEKSSAKTRRVRATDDPMEFRNRYFDPTRPKPKKEKKKKERKGLDA